MSSDNDPSKAKMIYESYIGFKNLTDRIERHSVDHRLMFDKIWGELKDLKSLFHQEMNLSHSAIEAQSTRMTKMETEKNIAIKIIVPIISVIVSLITSFFNKKL